MTAAIALLMLSTLPTAAGQTPADIRPAEIRGGITPEAAARGRALLLEAQEAYGLAAWKQKTSAEFEMTSQWHVPNSGWPTNPQKFRFHALQLGADDADLIFLNGPQTGQGWALAGGKHFNLRDGKRIPKDAPDPHAKMSIKNWWFQFPFRISEATVVADAGPGEVKGKKYNRVFATWESAEPNPTFDQYVIYIDPATKRMEWLHFTHRRSNPRATISMQLVDFRSTEGVLSPHRSIVHRGAPGETEAKVHENTIDRVRFDP